MVRTHNIEHIYYRNLAASEKNTFRRYYFNTEARKLERYEPRLAAANQLLSISPGDTEYFSDKYGNALFVGPFHPGDGCCSSTGRGDYVLMHGDFSTAENNAAALQIVREVAKGWKHKTVLAGKRPSAELQKAVSGYRHIRIIPNPGPELMNELITNAQVCLLNASQPTGMKLKLINALCFGRHVVASPAVVAGTSLEELCHVANSTGEWISHTEWLMKEQFTQEMMEKRTLILQQVADNQINAGRIIGWINNYSNKG
jgi:hypothetical protein